MSSFLTSTICINNYFTQYIPRESLAEAKDSLGTFVKSLWGLTSLS